MGKPNDRLKIQKAIMDLRGYIKSFPKEELWASELLLASGNVLTYDQIVTFFLNEIDAKFNDPKNFPVNYVEKIVYCLSAVLGREGLTKTIYDPNNIQRIRELGEKYRVFLEDNNLERHEGIHNLLLNIKALLAERPMRVDDTEELKVEDSAKEENNNVENNDSEKIRELEKEIEELRKQKNALERAIEKREKTNQALQEEAICKQKALREQLQDANNEISKLQKESQKQEAENQTKLDALNQEKEKLISRHLEHIQSKNEVITTLQQNESKREIHKFNLQKAREIILKNMYGPSVTMEGLFSILQTEKLPISKLEMKQIIHQLQADYNITTTKLEMPKRYKIYSQEVETKRKFNLNFEGESCEFLLVADQHNVNDFDKLQKNMDIIYNFATDKNIDYIFDLGDFFGADRISDNHFEECQRWQSIIEEMVKCIPNCDIPYGILGGNHDRYLLNLGFDPLQQLEMQKENIFSLGYDHATLTFSKYMIPYSFFMMHHDYFQHYEQDFYMMNTMLSNIEEYYKKNKLDRNASYIDFFGHYHRSLLNPEFQIASIPSLNVYHDRRGAWHVKVVLTQQGMIQYMIINPMILVHGRFEGINEIIYRRTKK